MKLHHVYKKTHDQWCGSYELGNSGELLVLVGFSQTGPNPPIDGEWIVYVAGNDDYSMHKLFDNEWAARTTHLSILLDWEYVDQEPLEALGFIYD